VSCGERLSGVTAVATKGARQSSTVTLAVLPNNHTPATRKHRGGYGKMLGIRYVHLALTRREIEPELH